MAQEARMKILQGAIQDTHAACLPNAVLKGAPTLTNLVAFVMQTHPQHTYTIEFVPQRASVLWWLEYAVDGLFRRRGRGLHFACIQGETLQQNKQPYVYLSPTTNRTKAEAETCRRLLATLESLPLTTRIILTDTYANQHGKDAHMSFSIAARDVVLATRKVQAESQYKAVQTQYNVDDLVKLLNTNTVLQPPQTPPPQPKLWVSDTLRRSERLMILLGGPMRLYYATLFLIGLVLLCLAYLWHAVFLA